MPKISQNSSDIANHYRQKIASQINEDKLHTFEWLAASGGKEEWIRSAQDIMEKEELKNCTFKPQIN